MEKFNLFSKYLKYYKDILDTRRIKKYDQGDSSKRDFKLVSTRNHEAQCIELFEEVFKEKMTKEFWNWKYAPHGMKLRGICAVRKGKVVGHYNGMARNILYFGKHKKAIASGDTMLSPKDRGGIKQNSPFYNMIKTWAPMNFGIRKEFILAYGFPNKRVFRLAEIIGLYTTVDTISEINWNIKDYEAQNDCKMIIYTNEKSQQDTLIKVWQQMAHDFNKEIIGVRNTQYITHRYFNHPKFKYLTYFINDSKGNTKAFIALKKENDKMLLMDIVASKSNFDSAINGALVICKSKNIAILNSWITTSKKKLFMHYNASLRQTDIIIPSNPDLPGYVKPEIVIDKWFLMYGDTDFI